MLKNKIPVILLLSLAVLVACVIAPTAVPVEPTATSTVAATSTSAPTVVVPTETIAPTDVPPTSEPPAGLSEELKLQAKILINTNCSVCHSTSRISAAEKDLAGWTSTVNRMLSKGAALSEDEVALVIQFLAEGNKP
jgi:cytochrome c5